MRAGLIPIACAKAVTFRWKPEHWNTDILQPQTQRNTKQGHDASHVHVGSSTKSPVNWEACFGNCTLNKDPIYDCYRAVAKVELLETLHNPHSTAKLQQGLHDSGMQPGDAP